MFSFVGTPIDEISRRFQAYGARVRYNLFFALLPSPEAIGSISQFGETACRAHRFRGKPIWPDRLHVTVLPVGHEHWGLPEILHYAQNAAERVQMAPVDVTLDTAESVAVRGSYPFVLRCRDDRKDILGLRRALAREMMGEGFDDLSYGSFSPHTTLMWADHAVDEYPIAPIFWTACEFALVLSYVGQSRHEHVGYWPLSGSGERSWSRQLPSTASRTATR